MANRRGGRRTVKERAAEGISPSPAIHSGPSPSTVIHSESSASTREQGVDPSQIALEPEDAAQTQLTTTEATNPESSKKSKGRGITCSKGARKAMRSTNSRLSVKLDFGLRKAVCNNAETFNNEIGYIVRTDCSLKFKDWRLVTEVVKKPLREKLVEIFDVDIDDENVRKAIDYQMQRAWRTFKYKLHTHFKRVGGDEDLTKAKESCPEECKKEDWEYLCNHWADVKYKEQAKKNEESRGKRKWDSRNGSKSTVRHHTARGLELNAPIGQIETWKLCHYDPKNGWSSPELEAKYEEMMQLRRDNPPEQMTDKIILEKVLGRQSNRLSGWGWSPSKSRGTSGEGSSRLTYSQALDELKEVKANYEALKDDFLKITQQLIDKNIVSGTGTTLAHAQSSHSSRPSRRSASPSNDHDDYSDFDDTY